MYPLQADNVSRLRRFTLAQHDIMDSMLNFPPKFSLRFCREPLILSKLQHFVHACSAVNMQFLIRILLYPSSSSIHRRYLKLFRIKVSKVANEKRPQIILSKFPWQVLHSNTQKQESVAKNKRIIADVTQLVNLSNLRQCEVDDSLLDR